ncbi:MAG: hypothetical protein ACPG31_13385 [Planctomycetota bacterium]
MRILSIVLLMVVVFTYTYCNALPPKVDPNLEQVLTYEEAGISFTYPGNWKIASASHHGSTSMVNLSAGIDGHIILSVVPGGAATTLEVWSRAFLEKGEERPGIPQSWGEIRSPQQQVGRFERLGLESFSDQTSPDFSAYLQLYRLVVGEDLIILNTSCQEDDLERMQPGFDLVLDSVEWSAKPLLDAEIRR